MDKNTPIRGKKKVILANHLNKTADCRKECVIVWSSNWKKAESGRKESSRNEKERTIENGMNHENLVCTLIGVPFTQSRLESRVQKQSSK